MCVPRANVFVFLAITGETKRAAVGTAVDYRFSLLT
jgi:hypothetical protein